MQIQELQAAMGGRPASVAESAASEVRFLADLELTTLASKACGQVATSVTEMLYSEDLLHPLGPRMGLAHACGHTLACLDGLQDTGRLRKTRIAQARRQASLVARAHCRLPETMLDLQQLVVLRRAQHLAHALGAALTEDDRDAAETAAGEFLDVTDVLNAMVLIDKSEVEGAYHHFDLETAQPILAQGGVQ